MLLPISPQLFRVKPGQADRNAVLAEIALICVRAAALVIEVAVVIPQLNLIRVRTFDPGRYLLRHYP